MNFPLLFDIYSLLPLSSAQFSHSVMSNSLQLHGLQRARPPCSSPILCLFSFPTKLILVHLLVSLVQFSLSVVSNSLRPHKSQHARPPCPSPAPGVHSNSCPSSRWCHPDTSSFVVPFSSCPQSLPASESFPMSQLFTWGGQSTGVSALASSFQRTPRTDLL